MVAASTLTSQIQLSAPFDEPASAALLRALAIQGLRANNGEQLRYVAAHMDTPVDVLMLLCHHKDCRDELGHRSGPRKLLDVMAGVYDYPEAVITIGIELYSHPDESNESFASFLARHGDSHWLLRSLIENTASTAEKAQQLADAVARHPDATALQAVERERELELRAAVETDAEELHRLYETNLPRVWRSLATNRHTPQPLLEALSAAQQVKNAREIRRLAGETLAAS